jgi:uncharacterized membrane protein (DUF485 family)
MPVQHHPVAPDEWKTLATEPEFHALVQSRRRFVVPATIFFVVYYFALPISVGFAPQFMSRPVWGPLTLAYAFALSQFLVAWILLALYLWQARSYDARAIRLRKHETEELRA